MPKNKVDDSKQALELLVLGREYLADVFALGVLRAEQAKTQRRGFVSTEIADGIRTLLDSIGEKERVIISTAKERFSRE